MICRRFTASAVLAFALLATSLTHAQVASRLTGSVQDPSGAAVPAATVDVYLPAGAKPIVTTNTTTEGLFAFVSIPSGTYDVIVTAAGFRKHTERGVILTPATETAMAGIKLEVGSVAEVVEVTSSAL